jgi:hypothetical protein
MQWRIVGFVLKTRTGKWPSNVLPVQEVENPCTGKMPKGLVLDQRGECPKVVGELKSCHSNK